jgi:hypothetical protein
MVKVEGFAEATSQKTITVTAPKRETEVARGYYEDLSKDGNVATKYIKQTVLTVCKAANGVTGRGFVRKMSEKQM